MDHLGLNSTVPEILSVEILRLFAHGVAHIPHDRNANVLLLNISCSFWSVNCGLVPLAQVLELLSLAGISNVKSGSQGVYVEEGILPVLNVGHWISVK